MSQSEEITRVKLAISTLSGTVISMTQFVKAAEESESVTEDRRILGCKWRGDLREASAMVRRFGSPAFMA